MYRLEVYVHLCNPNMRHRVPPSHARWITCIRRSTPGFRLTSFKLSSTGVKCGINNSSSRPFGRAQPKMGFNLRLSQDGFGPDISAQLGSPVSSSAVFNILIVSRLEARSATRQTASKELSVPFQKSFKGILYVLSLFHEHLCESNSTSLTPSHRAALLIVLPLEVKPLHGSPGLAKGRRMPFFCRISL